MFNVSFIGYTLVIYIITHLKAKRSKKYTFT